jgi:hypothetical protein
MVKLHTGVNMKTVTIAIFLIAHLSSAAAMNEKELQLAQQSIEALIRPLIPLKNKTSVPKTGFRIDQCDKHQKIDWREVLLANKDITLEYKFKEGCDIEGSIKPKIFTPFPASLNLRNLQKYKKIESQNKITSTLETTPIMNLDILSGTLTDDKGQILFEADYKLQINPLSRENFVQKNLGGEIRIKQIYQKKVSITRKIMVD